MRLSEGFTPPSTGVVRFTYSYGRKTLQCIRLEIFWVQNAPGFSEESPRRRLQQQTEIGVQTYYKSWLTVQIVGGKLCHSCPYGWIWTGSLLVVIRTLISCHRHPKISLQISNEECAFSIPLVSKCQGVGKIVPTVW